MKCWAWTICIFCAVCMGLLAAVPSPAMAVTPIASATATPASTAASQSDAETALRAKWERYAGSDVHEEFFSADHNLKGLFSQTTEYFHVGDWEIHEAACLLQFSSTQLLQRNVSEITLYLQGQPVYSGRIPATEGVRQQLVIPLPTESIQLNDTNALSMEVYMRSESTEICADDASGGKWMNIFQTSKVLVCYTPTARCNSIGEFYTQFTAIDTLENQRSALALPTTPDASVLTVAATVASGVSGNAVLNYENIALRCTDNLATLESYQYVLYIDRYERLGEDMHAALNEEQIAAAQAGAVVALVRQGECNVLLVTGSDEEALLQAGSLLANPNVATQLLLRTKAVSAQDDYALPEEATQQYVELTSTGTYMRGSFRQSATFNIEVPANRTVATSSALSLDLRYAQNLDFNKALVTVYVDEIPIGSKRLEADKAEGDTLELSFPDDLDITGNFALRVTFDLEVGDDWCRLSPEEMPWGFVASTSLLKLNATDGAPFVFEHYPSPFLRDGSMNNVVILLQDGSSEQELLIMNQLMLTMGRFLKDNRGDLRVAFASDTGDLSNSNVISIGVAQRNPAVLAFGDALYFKFDAQGALQSNQRMQVDPQYGEVLGAVQLLDSLYSKQTANALLVISAGYNGGLLRAATYLCATDKLWEITGDGYVSDGDVIYCYNFDHDQETILPPATLAAGASTDSGHSLITVAGGALLLCLLAVVLLIVKYSRGDKHESK